MNILIVDDEQNALFELEHTVKSVCKDAQIVGFTSPKDALNFASTHDIDIVFLDIEMRTMNGLQLAKALKDIHPYVNLIFVTGYSQYAVDAFSIRSSGYLLKPASREDVETELEHLRMPITTRTHIRVQTFGNFEVFIDDSPMLFPRARIKEILAYLIDRKGASVTMGELAGVLWEDKPFTTSQKSYLRTLISELMSTLKEYQVESIVIKTHNSIAVDITKFSCDYYDFLRMKVSAINAFCGEYMSNYSWAEFTLGSLVQHVIKK